MKKRIFAILCSLAMFITIFPNAYADTYVNEAFVGRYLSAGATASNYGELNILTCNSSSITVDFKFVKNDNQQLVYTCYEGTMNNTKGTIPFTVSYTNGRFVANGIMDITLTDSGVKVSCNSDSQHLFDGIMTPQFAFSPYGSQPSSPTNEYSYGLSTDVSVVLNGEKINFPNEITPIIINDFTYVPLRSVFDRMGINVYWDQYKKNDILNAQSITCTKNDIIVQFTRTYNDSGSNVWTLTKWVGENTDSLNYTRINITDLQPTIIENSSYIPLRVVSEAFGADVGWIHESRTVTIDCDITNAYKYDATLIGNIEDFSQDMATTFITDDYRSVKAYSTPYFSPQAKFYKYSAVDTWNEVELRIFYGGFLEVAPVIPNEEAPVAPPAGSEKEADEVIIDDPSDTAEEDITEILIEESDEDTAEETPVDIPIEAPLTDDEL